MFALMFAGWRGSVSNDAVGRNSRASLILGSMVARSVWGLLKRGNKTNFRNVMIDTEI